MKITAFSQEQNAVLLRVTESTRDQVETLTDMVRCMMRGNCAIVASVRPMSSIVEGNEAPCCEYRIVVRLYSPEAFVMASFLDLVKNMADFLTQA